MSLSKRKVIAGKTQCVRSVLSMQACADVSSLTERTFGKETRISLLQRASGTQAAAMLRAESRLIIEVAHTSDCTVSLTSSEISQALKGRLNG